VAHAGENKNSYRIFEGKLEAQKPPGRHWRREEDNIKLPLNTRWGKCGQD
jgi:hypothetical protein